MDALHSLPPGWLVNNCFQLDDGTWRVNLRCPSEGGSWFTDFADGPTIEVALRDCIDTLEEAVFAEERKQPTFTLEKAPILSLTNLGLAKPTSINRRI